MDYFLEHNKDISKVNEHFNDPLTYARAYKDTDKLRDIEYDNRAKPKHIGDLLVEDEIPF